MYQRNPESTRCTAASQSGKFCDAESLPDAPFPICLKHAARVMAYLNDRMPRDMGDRTILMGRSIDQARAATAERERRKPPVRGHVYYIQVGDLIKIGHSDNLTKRIGQYPPDARLLATEIGTRTLEAQRHREFAAALKYRNEWFTATPELMAHIDSLKQRAA